MTRMTTCTGCNKKIPDTSTFKCPCRKRKSRTTSELNDSDKLRKTYRWKQKRLWIIRLDNGHCQRCLHKYSIINSDKLEVHHIKPAIKHIDLFFEDENLVTLCRTCNMQIGTKDELDFNWSREEYEPSL